MDCKKILAAVCESKPTADEIEAALPQAISKFCRIANEYGDELAHIYDDNYLDMLIAEQIRQNRAEAVTAMLYAARRKNVNH